MKNLAVACVCATALSKGEQMRILHTGDLHLDSAFCAYGVKDAQKHREAGRALLRRIFDCANKEACQMILIAGDLFDSKFVSPETSELFCDLVDKCGIPVVVSPGNHDSYSDSSFYAKAVKKLGEKLTVFTSSELQVFDFDELGVSVFGYAFTSAALAESVLLNADVPEENGNMRIFCAHADITSPLSRYAPITLGQLQKFDFSYCALGHIHNRGDFEDTEGKVRYCGFAQGRSFDEIGEGGVWIVDVEQDNVSVQKRVLSEISFHNIEVSLGFSDQDVTEKLLEAVRKKKYPSGSHLRLVITGISEKIAGNQLSCIASKIKDELGIQYVEIEDETLPLIDGEYLERDATLRGELYRTLKPGLLSEDVSERKAAVKALQIGLAAIDGKSIFSIHE